MRKSKRCTLTKLERLGGLLKMRTCLRERNHTGSHMDTHGAWRSDDDANAMQA